MNSQNKENLRAPLQVSPKPPFAWFTEEAREELAQRHYQKLIGIAQYQNAPEPEHAASNAVMRALRDFDPDKGLFIGLARKALDFEILDQRRRHKRRPVPERLAEDFEIAAPEIHHFADRVELDRLVLEIWMTLNLVDQRLLWLRIVGGFTFKEIGAQMDFVGCPMPPGTMRCRYCRAIRKFPVIRQHFGDIEFSDIVDSIHRVAKACGTLDFTTEKPTRPIRSRARREAAQERCKAHRQTAKDSQLGVRTAPETSQ